MRVLFRSVRVFALALIVGGTVAYEAAGQGISVLAPVQPSYSLRGFSLTPPTGDGWRELGGVAPAIRLVYAEDMGDGRINTRAEVVAEAFDIPDPAIVSDAARLGQTAQNQHAAERGDRLIAFSRVAQLAEAKHVYSFTLVTKSGEQDLQEVFFVALARDKSEYFIAKLGTTDGGYREAPYFAPLVSSLASLAHRSDEEQDDDGDDGGAAGEAEAESEGEGDDEGGGD